MTQEEALQTLITRVKSKSRFSSIDNSIPTISEKEYAVAAESAMDIVNAFPPMTGYTIEGVFSASGPVAAIRPILVDLTIRELVFTLMMDWLANSEESETIEMFTVSSKYSQYNSLYDQLWSSVEPRLTEVKKTIGTVVRGKSYPTDYAVKISGLQYKQNLINRLDKSLRGYMG